MDIDELPPFPAHPLNLNLPVFILNRVYSSLYIPYYCTRGSLLASDFFGARQPERVTGIVSQEYCIVSLLETSCPHRLAVGAG